MKKRLTAVFGIIMMIMMFAVSTSPPTPTVSASTSTLASQAIGSIVRFEVGGVLTEFIVVHQGRPSADYVGFEGGTVLMTRNIITNRQVNSSAMQDYANSGVHVWLNGGFFNSIESDIRGEIAQIRIPYRRGGNNTDSTVSRGSNGLQCRIFVPSLHEVGGTGETSFPNIGTAFSFFSGINHNNNTDRRIASFNGVAETWWSRSPFISVANNSFFSLTVHGGYTVSSSTTTRGVRPVLVLPNTLTVDVNGRVLGVVEPPTSPPTEPPTEPTTEPPTSPPTDSSTDPTDPSDTSDPDATSAPDDDSAFTPELAALITNHIVTMRIVIVVVLAVSVAIGLWKIFGLFF
jgi:hypothetical protein